MATTNSTLSAKIECPYCGSRVRLGDCPIVATEAPIGKLPILSDGAGAATRPVNDRTEDAGFDAPSASSGPIAPIGQSGFETVSRSAILGWTRSGWPIIRRPPFVEQVTSSGRRKVTALLKTMPSIAGEAPIEDLPARACPVCGQPMPIDTGIRPLKILAVVGTIGAGKTHFLASALHDAFHNQSLLPYGYSEFFPDEATAYRFDKYLFEPIIAEMKAADPTTREDFTPYLPLCFRVSRGQRTATVLIHDIPGEALMDRGAKALLLPFSGTLTD